MKRRRLAVLALPALLFYFPGWAAHLQFDRGAAAHGEAWRLVTCHWTHWSPDHLLWNVAAFVLLAAVCERFGPSGRKALLVAVAASALAIPAILWIALPTMERYRGL
ncbi:MAG TPA: rhomboid family intramembrane serine protease, partial [Thermoanaerobaculia bacterium]